MEVKAIDYFNPPICESVILVALHSTGESLMGLSAACLRPLPVQLTFNWNLPGAGPGRRYIPLSLRSGATDSQNPLSLECHQLLSLIRHFSFFLVFKIHSLLQMMSLSH